MNLRDRAIREQADQAASQINIERRIVRRLVRDLLAAGYEVTVNNGGEENEIPYSRNYTEIAAALFATDDEHLLVRKLHRDIYTHSFVYLVYGNDYDVICDYGVNLEPVIGPIEEWAYAQEAK